MCSFLQESATVRCRKQAGAELGQAQVKLEDIVVAVVKAMVEVEVQLLFRVGGGWSDKTKLILISTLVEVVVEVEVELGNVYLSVHLNVHHY